MNRSKENHKNKKRQRQLKRRIAIVFVLLAVVGGVIFGSVFVSAHGSSLEDPVNYKYYKNIEVMPGDSLWKLAGMYMSEEYDSRAAYIKEVVQINQLTSHTIYDGQKLIVPYYDTDFR
ncbi:MAG TPA: hypothetical protein DCZ20_11475 [Lachnospiraceae bacterium]|nr:hypothetical protein [Lachnospiraceae bacterium]